MVYALGVSRAVLRRLVLMLALSGLFGCTSEPDPRLAMPQNTVETLLRATHLWRDAEPAALGVRPRRIEAHRPPPDIERVALCFWDYDRDDPVSRAMGEFVAGMLAAFQGDLVYYQRRHTAAVQTGSRQVHMRRASEGWLIVLRQTIPEEIRASLHRAPRSQGLEEDPL